MFNQALRDDIGHVLIGVVHTLSALKAQREAKGVALGQRNKRGSTKAHSSSLKSLGWRNRLRSEHPRFKSKANRGRRGLLITLNGSRKISLPNSGRFCTYENKR